MTAQREPNPKTVTALLVGNRRAHQILRHLEDGAEDQADVIIRELGTPLAWLSVERNFTSIRTSLPRWADDKVLVANLVKLLDRANGDQGAMRTWLLASGHYTLAAIKTVWPKADDRARFYQNGAQMAYNAEEPGSFMRRKAFGQTDECT